MRNCITYSNHIPFLPGSCEHWHKGRPDSDTDKAAQAGTCSEAGSRTWPIAAAPVAGLVAAPAAAPGGQNRNGDRQQDGLWKGVILPLVVVPYERTRSEPISACEFACCCDVTQPGRLCQRPRPSSASGQLPDGKGFCLLALSMAL